MKKSICFLLISTIISAPLYAGTRSSVSREAIDDEEETHHEGLVYVPSGSLTKLQHDQDKLREENERLKKLNTQRKEEEGKEPEEDKPAPPSADLEKEKAPKEASSTSLISSFPSLSFEETPLQDGPKLKKSISLHINELVSSLFSSFFEKSNSEVGFDPKLIDLYTKASPTFAKYAACNDKLIQFKSHISKELFQEFLVGEKDNTSLLIESARLGKVSDYASEKNRITDPHGLFVIYLLNGMGGIEKNEKQALKLMQTYGSLGHEGMRELHLVKFLSIGHRFKSTKIIERFRQLLQGYVDQKSEVATKIASYLLAPGRYCFPMQLPVDVLFNINIIDFKKYVFNLPATKLPTDKEKLAAHIESLLAGKNGHKQDPQKAAYELSVEHGIFIGRDQGHYYTDLPIHMLIK